MIGRRIISLGNMSDVSNCSLFVLSTTLCSTLRLKKPQIIRFYSCQSRRDFFGIMIQIMEEKNR